MWFDSHCHLHLVEDVAGALAAAPSAGVDSLVAIGIDVPSAGTALSLARDHDLWSSAGVHPNSALEWDDGAAEAIESLLKYERVVGVGETGLDFYRDSAPPDRQRAAFRDHITLAKSYDKCLIIHTRESVVDAMEMLEREGPPQRLIFHCWSAGPRELDRAVALGAHISFAGNVTFKNAQSLREMSARVPEDRLLVETDSPFLAPTPHRGRPNEPSYLPLTGAAVAHERGVSPEHLAEVTTANARRVFGLR